VHFAVTAHPTTAWVIQQLREAMPFGQQPTYLFRDNDRIYGVEVDLLSVLLSGLANRPLPARDQPEFVRSWDRGFQPSRRHFPLPRESIL
jgi:hypothetical protein